MFDVVACVISIVRYGTTVTLRTAINAAREMQLELTLSIALLVRAPFYPLFPLLPLRVDALFRDAVLDTA
jgi:hypothetical protein